MVQKITLNRALTDTQFAKEVFRKLPPDSFDTEAEKVLSKEINRYYLTNDKTMTETTLKTYIEGRMDSGLAQDKAEDVMELIEDVYSVTTELDEEVAITELDKHVRRALTLKTLKEFISQDELDDGESLENLGKEITNIALLDTSNSGDENFLDLLNDTDRKIELYKNLRTKAHPTGFDNIDAMLDGGGLGRGEVALFIAGTGQGKALVNGTKVYTPRGPINIEDLKIRDKVFGTDGKPHNVVGVFPQGKKRVYEIEFSDGTVIENNDEHIWTFQTARQRQRTGGWTTTTLRDMIDNYDISLPSGKYRRNNMYLPVTKPVEYEEKEVKLDPYTLGALLGDGGLGDDKLDFYNSEQDVIRKVDKGLNEVEYSLSDNKHIPEEYKYGSVNQRLEVLRGLVDTDGEVEGSAIKITSTSKQLANDVRDIANSLGMVSKLHTKEDNQYTYKGVKMNGRTSYRVTIKTAKGGLLPFSSKKHKEKFKQGQTDARVYVTDIRETSRYEEMTCISVDADNKLFLTENYIPTHNTSVAIQSANNYVKQGMNVLYVTLEEKLERMAVRLETNLIGANISQFYNDQEMINEELIKQLGETYKTNDQLGNLYISKHNPREVTIEKLEQLIINTKLRKGLEVDVVILDYPALMQVPGRNKVHEEQGELFERIRGLSQKYNFIALTLAQTNRTAWGADVVTLNNIEGGFMVANACELVLTVNRTQEEYEEGFFRMHVDKVRNRSNKVIPSMLSFTVDSKGYRMRGSTPQEEEKHMSILKEAGREDSTDGFAKANETVDSINKLL